MGKAHQLRTDGTALSRSAPYRAGPEFDFRAHLRRDLLNPGHFRFRNALGGFVDSRQYLCGVELRPPFPLLWARSRFRRSHCAVSERLLRGYALGSRTFQPRLQTANPWLLAAELVMFSYGPEIGGSLL